MLAIHAMLADATPAAMVYTDSALIDAQGRLTAPRLKPDWSPEFLRHRDYVGGLWLLDAALAKTVAPTLRPERGPLRRQLPPAMAERTTPDRIRHIKRMILLQPEQPTSDFPAPAPAVSSEPEPSVSIVIPTRDRLALLQRAIGSLRDMTRYANYEIVVVDNASTERPVIDYLERLRAQGIARVIEDRGEFNFPRLVNRAVAAATGQVVVLLNNDTFVIEPGWLAEMVRLAVQPGIGAVGAKLLYPDGTIQHAGVVVGLLGYAGHYFRRLPANHGDHLGRLAAVHEVSAVTAACLAITRTNYDAAGGFDESLAIDFNDVDFCLRLTRMGLRNLWTPHAVLGHAESASRTGPKGRKSPRFQAEARRFAGRWRAETLNDPYFHPALALRVFDEMIE
jgi:GT2 family glycosyltransferase